MACLKELSVPLEHPTWSVAPLVVEPMDPPQAFSPFVLPGFNEEEMLEDETNEIPKKAPEVASELGQAVIAVVVDGIVAKKD